MVSKKHLLAEMEALRDGLFGLINAVHQHVDAATKLGHEADLPLPIHAPTSSMFAQERLALLRLADLNALHAEMATLRANAEQADTAIAAEATGYPAPTAPHRGSVFFDGKRLHFGVDHVNDSFGQSKTPEQVRRETLEKVIEALEIDEYRDGAYTIFGNLFTNGPERGSDRFWSDITTALRVRAEDAEAEADEAAEARIAAITRPAPATDEVYSAGETIIDSSGRDQ